MTPQPIYLRDYWRVVRRWWWIPLLSVMATLLWTMMQSQHVPHLYEAASLIQVDPVDRGVQSKSGPWVDESLDIGTQVSNLQSQATAYKVATALDGELREKLLASASRQQTSEQQLLALSQVLLGTVTVARVSGTRLVELRFRHTEARVAQQVAALWATVYLSTFAEDCRRRNQETTNQSSLLTDRSVKGQTGAATEARLPMESAVSCRLRLSLISPPLSATRVATSRPNLLVPLFLSVIGGIGVALLIDHLRDRIEAVEDIGQYLSLPVLSWVRANSGKGTPQPATKLPDSSAVAMLAGEGGKLVQSFDPAGPNIEAYRRLRVAVMLALSAAESRIILVTSSLTDNATGGSAIADSAVVAANLALSFADSGAATLLVDCDLLCPKLPEIFGLNQELGLIDYLDNGGEVQSLARHALPNLSVLPAGVPKPDTPASLSSVGAKQKLQGLAKSYDCMVLSAPPVLSSADALFLSALASGVVIVVELGKSSRRAARQSLAQLQAVGPKILGAVAKS